MHRMILYLLSFFMRIAVVVRSICSRFQLAAFVRGMGSVLSIGSKNNYDNIVAADPVDADAKAIASDWEMVGEDIRRAMGLYEGGEASK